MAQEARTGDADVDVAAAKSRWRETSCCFWRALAHSSFVMPAFDPASRGPCTVGQKSPPTRPSDCEQYETCSQRLLRAASSAMKGATSAMVWCSSSTSVRRNEATRRSPAPWPPPDSGAGAAADDEVDGSGKTERNPTMVTNTCSLKISSARLRYPSGDCSLSGSSVARSRLMYCSRETR